MIRQVTYQKQDGTMKTKWIFREDGDFSKDYSDFKTMEQLLNRIYEKSNAKLDSSLLEGDGDDCSHRLKLFRFYSFIHDVFSNEKEL